MNVYRTVRAHELTQSGKGNNVIFDGNGQHRPRLSRLGSDSST